VEHDLRFVLELADQLGRAVVELAAGDPEGGSDVPADVVWREVSRKDGGGGLGNAPASRTSTMARCGAVGEARMLASVSRLMRERVAMVMLDMAAVELE
jgi:hypothetical protein